MIVPFLGFLLMGLFGFSSGLVYTAVASQLVGRREPGFSLVMMGGLLISMTITGLVSGSTLSDLVAVYLMSCGVFGIIRCVFCQVEAMRLFILPHAIAIIAIIIIPTVR